MTLPNKQRAFVEEYLRCWNATEAARRIGYAHPNMAGPRMILKDSIQEVVRQRVSEIAMSTDEILLRQAEIARSDMGDFLDINSMGFVIDLAAAKEKGITHLIRKVKQRTTTHIDENGSETEIHQAEIELYDAQAALNTLGKYKGLEKLDLSDSININVTLKRDE